jgi:uncharacterized protein (TIGR02246 family)
MNKNILGPLMFSVLAVLTGTAFGADQSDDEAGIRSIETRQQEAWNRHDPKAYASLFTENGDCVNVVGWWWKGRAEIERKLTEAHAFVFRDSVLTINEVDVRFVSPEFAVVHVRWTMVGARTPTGIPVPQQGIQTQLVQKQSGRWLIASFQNTNAMPEMPFPKGPPAPEAGATVKP